MAIHPSAIIDSTAEIHESCDIGPNVRIGAGCRLGEGNILMDGAILGPNTVAGKRNVFHYHSVVGHEPQFLGFDSATKSGTIIGDENHFREFCQIHRGLKEGGSTIIGNGNFFMATSHVAHDCSLGDNNVLANYAGLAGHVTVGDRSFISTLVGIHQFCRVGSLTMVGGMAGVSKDIPPFTMLKGYGVVLGLNVVGLRRAGVGPQTRLALKQAYKEIFRSSRPVSESIALLRAEWEGEEMPKELAYFIDFCGTKSKRGLSRGPRKGSGFMDEELETDG